MAITVNGWSGTMKSELLLVKTHTETYEEQSNATFAKLQLLDGAYKTI
jgi:hypothetical protein